MALEVSPGLQAGKQVSFGRAQDEKPNTLLGATGSMVAGGALGAAVSPFAFRKDAFSAAGDLTTEKVDDFAEKLRKAGIAPEELKRQMKAPVEQAKSALQKVYDAVVVRRGADLVDKIDDIPEGGSNTLRIQIRDRIIGTIEPLRNALGEVFKPGTAIDDLLKTVVQEASGDTPEKTAGNLVDDAMRQLKEGTESVFEANKAKLGEVKAARWGTLTAIGAGIGLGLYAGYRAFFAKGNK